MRLSTRQATIQAEPESLCFGHFMAQNNISFQSECLEKLIREIDTLSPEAPLSFRDDDPRVRCLRRALLDVPWAQAAIGQLYSMNITFNQFLSSLCDGLQLHAAQDSALSTAVLFQRHGR